MSENDNISAIPSDPAFPEGVGSAPFNKKHDDCPPALLEAAAAYKRHQEKMKKQEHDPVDRKSVV